MEAIESRYTSTDGSRNMFETSWRAFQATAVEGALPYQSHPFRHNLELIRTWRDSRIGGTGDHMLAARGVGEVNRSWRWQFFFAEYSASLLSHQSQYVFRPSSETREACIVGSLRKCSFESMARMPDASPDGKLATMFMHVALSHNLSALVQITPDSKPFTPSV